MAKRVRKMNCLGRFRREAGLSQSEVADMLGISQAVISDWEAGKRYPRVDVLLLLAQIYGCDVNDLLKIPVASVTKGGEIFGHQHI